MFNLWVYKVQLNDASLDEVSGASGLDGGAGAGNMVGGGGPGGETESLLGRATGSSVPTATRLTMSYTASTKSKKPQETHSSKSG